MVSRGTVNIKNLWLSSQPLCWPYHDLPYTPCICTVRICHEIDFLRNDLCLEINILQSVVGALHFSHVSNAYMYLQVLHILKVSPGDYSPIL